MTSVVHITLDTHAPQVTWGAPAGTVAGELLQVAYTSDEPIDRAVLVLPDNRRVTLTVEADRVSGVLPYDTPTGRASLLVRDEVWNETTSLRIDVSGAVGPAPDHGTGGPPVLGPRDVSDAPTPRPPRRRRVRAASTVRLKSEARAEVGVRDHATAVWRSRSRTQMTSRTSEPVRVGETTRIRVGHDPTRVRVTTSTSQTVSRHDGPDFEAAVVLGLL